MGNKGKVVNLGRDWTRFSETKTHPPMRSTVFMSYLRLTVSGECLHPYYV